MSNPQKDHVSNWTFNIQLELYLPKCVNK